nr:hypothetical protein BaRGS_024954 [Batillaria attramentaria]
MSRVYPNDRPLEEGDFVQTVMALPRDSVMSILNFHILPENMRENVHRNLPEFSSRQVGYSPAPGFSPMSAVGPEPSSQVPSDPILNEIAQRIHRRDWDLLANRLGFMADDIDNYRQMYPSSSAQQKNFNVVIFSESTNSRGTKLGMLIDNCTYDRNYCTIVL